MYWNRYVTRQPRNVPQKPTPKQQNTVSTGTGFFINSAGHLVTNNHVVESCSNIRVKGFGVDVTVWLKLVFHRELPKYSPISTNNRYNVISDQLLNEPDHAFGLKYAYRTSHQWFHWG